MLDVHPPHHPLHSWREFLIHIATITVGLLIAVGIEQTVESVHHSHQRHQLEEDLRTEAERNHELILKDLDIQQQRKWFEGALEAAKDAPAEKTPFSTFRLETLPCIPGSVGSVQHRYFAPSEAVWTAARESGLVALLPADQARIYARLAHNNDLLARERDKVSESCDRVVSMERRFATRASDNRTETWKLNERQRDEFSNAAAETDTAISGLLFRLRSALSYEQAIADGVKTVDDLQAIINRQAAEELTSRATSSPGAAHAMESGK